MTGSVDAEVAVAGAAHVVRVDVLPWPEPTRADASRLDLRSPGVAPTAPGSDWIPVADLAAADLYGD